MTGNVFIIGVHMTKFGKHMDRSIKMLAGEALAGVLKDAGLERKDIEAAWFSNSGWGIYEFQHSIRGQVALSANGLERIPIINVENACASGSTALHSAWMALKAGVYDCVLALGAEKLYHEDRGKVMNAFIAGTDVEVTMQFINQLKAEEKKRREKEGDTSGAGGGKEKKGGHSAFMDLYAMGARRHMEMYGTTQRQLAVIAAKAHHNSTLNPLAQYTFPVSTDGVLADRPVAFPLTRSMCAPIGDGAAAAILCSERFLKAHSSSRAARIRASVLTSGQREGVSDLCRRGALNAYEIAGIGPEDINLAEVHDATAYGELYQTEQLGFCAEGEGGPFAESGATSLGGSKPVNTSGGLISRGHPIGASGLAQVFELVTQLRGEAGERQVESPRIAMAENGGGFLGSGEAATAIHIFEKWGAP